MFKDAARRVYFFDHYAQTHVHVSRDIQKTATAEGALIADCLKTVRSFVIDDTNATRQVRTSYMRDAKAGGFRVIGYFFDVPTRLAIGRNNHRKDKKPIPVPAILRTAKRLEGPSVQEGFDEIRVIHDLPA